MKKNITKSASTMNAAFAYWVAISTMGSKAAQLNDWANTGAGVTITGANIDKDTVKKLFDAFPGGTTSFTEVLDKARTLAQIDEWDPHDQSVAILNSISKL